MCQGVSRVLLVQLRLHATPESALQITGSPRVAFPGIEPLAKQPLVQAALGAHADLELLDLVDHGAVDLGAVVDHPWTQRGRSARTGDLHLARTRVERDHDRRDVVRTVGLPGAADLRAAILNVGRGGHASSEDEVGGNCEG